MIHASLQWKDSKPTFIYSTISIGTLLARWLDLRGMLSRGGGLPRYPQGVAA
jgi:hypothetical protein